jgi:hypothetical protein
MNEEKEEGVKNSAYQRNRAATLFETHLNQVAEQYITCVARNDEVLGKEHPRIHNDHFAVSRAHRRRVRSESLRNDGAAKAARKKRDVTTGV